MSHVAAEIRSLGKHYRLGASRGYRTLREGITDFLKNPGGLFGGDDKSAPMLWALKNISLDILSGQSVGIIGGNGAGKSTLLKILSRITEPSVGHARIRGRVGSLLEVGTGFHPELTGRENIYLNGAILGMSRADIRRNFDQIVAFAEIQAFLDTPVKHYSSGMYIRLAFAVAAHLEPEILIIDEVLAVGDAVFQKKCLGKMDEVARSGRTVLFVSHNMGAVKSLTNRVIWLDRGDVREDGPPDVVIDHYLRGAEAQSADGRFDGKFLSSNRSSHEKYLGQLRVTGVQLRDSAGTPTAIFREGSEVSVELEFEATQPFAQIEPLLRIRTMEGQLIFACMPGMLKTNITPGRVRMTMSFSLDRLIPGIFQGDVVLMSQLPQDSVAPAFQFEVIEDADSGQSYRGNVFGGSTTSSPSAVFGLFRVPSRIVHPPEPRA